MSAYNDTAESKSNLYYGISCLGSPIASNLHLGRKIGINKDTNNGAIKKKKQGKVTT